MPEVPGDGAVRGRRLRSVRSRTTLGAAAVVAAALVLGAAVFLVVLRSALVEGVRQTASAGLDQVTTRVEAEGPDAVRTDDDDQLVQVVDGDGAVLAHGEDAGPPAFPVAEESRYRHDGESWLLVADDVELPDGREASAVVGASLDDADRATAVAAALLGVGVPIVVLVMALVVSVVVGRALRPVERMRREVDDIQASDQHGRLAVPDSGDEVARLATTMNRMLDRLARSDAARRRFVSDASHELRSPIASLRQHAVVAGSYPGAVDLEELVEVVGHESTRLQELVDGLLALSRLDEGGPAARVPVDLDDLALDEVRRIRAATAEPGSTGVRIDGSGIGPAQVLGDPVLLARVVRNLVDNAVRHADSSVSVQVRVEGASAVVEVEDDGHGVPPSERERVFDRFVRLDEGRSRDAGGSGLGLAIVRDTVVAHGGSVRITDGTSGGARFVIVLPLGA